MTRPPPVLQAPGSLDCTFAAAAWVARLFGHEADVGAVRAWSGPGSVEGGRSGAWFPADALGVPWTPCRYEGPERALWWLGPDARPWVERWLSAGHVGYACVHAGHASMMHAVVLLDGDAEGVTLMDPEKGFVRWTWGRFLGAGSGRGRDPLTVHRVVGWYGPVPGALVRAA